MTTIALVKQRMGEMRDGIDDAEVRTKEYEQAKREAEARGYTFQSDAMSLRNRMSQLQQEIDRLNAKVAEQTAKLEGAEGRTEEHDTVRKDLEGKETNNDQDLDFTEKTLMETKVLVTENTMKYDDAVTKLKVVEGDLERATERLSVAQAKVDELEEKASEANTSLKDLETRDEEASNREITMEERMKFLANQLKETIQRAETAERECNKLELHKEGIDANIESEKKRIASVKAEMEEIVTSALDD